MLKRFLFFLCFFSFPVFAQNVPSAPLSPAATIVQQMAVEQAGPNPNPSILTKISVMACLTLLPFAIMLLTSFMKIIVVLSLLRNALGVNQTPPNQVLNGIAMKAH